VATTEEADYYARFDAVLRKHDVNPFIASVKMFVVKTK